MVCEIAVSIKDEEKSLTKKFFIYDDVLVSEEDPIIKSCIEETLENFSSEPSRITVKIKLEIE